MYNLWQNNGIFLLGSDIFGATGLLHQIRDLSPKTTNSETKIFPRSHGGNSFFFVIYLFIRKWLQHIKFTAWWQFWGWTPNLNLRTSISYAIKMTHNSGEILHLFGFFKVQRFEPKIVEFSYTYMSVYRLNWRKTGNLWTLL